MNIKNIFYVSIVPLVIGLFFFSNIKGYYRFKELCSEHKELVVYQKLEPNVGWQTDKNGTKDRDNINEYLYFVPQISFFRFQNYDDRKLYDARFVGGHRMPYEKFDSHTRSDVESNELRDQGKYEHSLANIEIKPIYQLENFSETIPNETRMSRGGYRIRDLRTDQIVVSLEDIGYSIFDRNHTLLDAPSGNICRFAPSIYSSIVQKEIFAK
jgi:hypothetical protein